MAVTRHLRVSSLLLVLASGCADANGPRAREQVASAIPEVPPVFDCGEQIGH